MLNFGISASLVNSIVTYSALGLITGAANIIRMYRMDITNILVPATVASFLSGFKPRLATQLKNRRTARVVNCTAMAGNES